MTSPAELIANLEAALADAGELVTVRRYTAASGDPRPKIDEPNVPAAVRALKADELIGAINQTWSRVILSPTRLAAFLPLIKADKIVIQGRERNVEIPQPVFVQGVLVRVVVLVSG